MGKRIISFVLALALVLGAIPVTTFAASTIVDSGKCGENVTWVLYEDGLLEINGSGAIPDYSAPNLPPWFNYDYRIKITEVHISDGITSIGKLAFEDCKNLNRVVIGKDVVSIGESAFSSCKSLTSLIIPDGVTAIGNSAFQFCNLNDVSIPDSVVSIGSSAFSYCELTTISIGPNTTYIGTNAFGDCDSLTEINIDKNNPQYSSDSGGVLFNKDKTELIQAPCKLSGSYIIPDSVTSINPNAFYGCADLTSVVFGKAVTSIGAHAFHFCENLSNVTFSNNLTTIGFYSFCACDRLDSITIPSSVVSIEEGAFALCNSLTDVYYEGTQSQWDTISVDNRNNDPLTNATIHFASEDGLAIYSDHTNLSIRKDNIITLGAGIILSGELTSNISGITFQIEDPTILTLSKTTTANNRHYIKLKGLKEGTTFVVFSDSATGYTKKVPITVFNDNFLSYTLSSVPVQHIDKYPTNVYNANGLYIDSYTYTVNKDKSATVSFDVYNTSYTYGAVEVFDENGNLEGAVLIEKMKSSNTSIKEALWDNLGYLKRDIFEDDLLTYRQESGFSKKTSVKVTIPENGYIKICNDPQNSFIVSIVNSADMLMGLASLAGDIKGYDVNAKLFSKKLTLKLVNERIFAEFVKDGSKMPEKLWKNVSKDVFFSSESLGNFANTIAKNISDLKLDKIIADTAADFGWNTGEDVFAYFSGPIGLALKGMFAIGKVENLITQHCDINHSANVGSVFIQNQGGGKRGSQQIIVESDSGFSEGTSLNVFRVTIDSIFLDLIKEIDPELYETVSEGVTVSYNISLLKDGEETQPDSEVTVYIPIPEELKLAAYAGKTAIYRIEEDGTYTELDYKIEKGCFVFKTNHFSLYTLVGKVDVDNPYSDVVEGKYYYDSVLWAVENSITNGMDDTHFAPDGNCTRAQVVTFLWRAAGSPEPTSTYNPFTDVFEGRFYYKAVLWAVENGITNGMTATTFGTDQPCTRGQVATFLWRTRNKPASNGTNPFTDVEQGTFYYNAVLWAVENGITNGMTTTTFAPNGTCTRGQIVTFLYRTLA